VSRIWALIVQIGTNALSGPGARARHRARSTVGFDRYSFVGTENPTDCAIAATASRSRRHQARIWAAA
jgi:hypothetical protein